LLSDLRLKAAKLQASDFGVVFGIMMIEMELELTNYLSAMVARLSQLSGISAKVLDCDGPDFTEIEIYDYLRSFEVRISEEGIYQISKRRYRKDQILKPDQNLMV
jgi:hypothetical protein